MRLCEGGSGDGWAALGVAEHDYIYFTKLGGPVVCGEVV
jgi:hypothetical protein